MDRSFVEQQVKGLFDEILAARRFLHAHPELGDNEFVTQKFIMDFLAECGVKHFKCADTGVVGIVEGERSGKVVAMRADIDALPITEKSDAAYCSQNPGVMHACGHDVHTAINLGCAKFFANNRDKFGGAVKFFFQPAEEGRGGAMRMVEQGCMKSPDVDYVIGLHMMPYMNYNQVEIKSGTLNASTDSVRITVTGKKGHGAYPDRCVDAVIITAQILVALQTLVSRSVSPLDSAVFTAGSIHGGEASNIVADEVVVMGTVRSSSPKVKSIMFGKMKDIATAIARSMGGDCTIEPSKDGYLPLINDDGVLDVIRRQATEYLGEKNVLVKEFMSMGGEDFSFFNEHTPGAFYHLGCRVQSREEYFLHTAEFDVDERCLVTGMVVEIMSALELLAK